MRLLVRVMNRESHDERRAFARRTPRRDLSPVTFRYFATDCQANAGTFVNSASVEALEHRENALGVLLLEADAVVTDDDARAAVVALAAHFDARRHALAVELQRIADEVLQELAHLQRIGVDRRQRADDDLAAGVVRAELEVVRDFAGDLPEVDGGEGLGLRRDARKRQEIVDENLHPLRGGLHAVDVVARLRGELAGVLGLQAVAEGLDLPQRLLQVVRGDVGEVLELAVAGLEAAHGRVQLFLGTLALADVAGDDDRALLYVDVAHRRDGDADVDGMAVLVPEEPLLVADGAAAGELTQRARDGGVAAQDLQGVDGAAEGVGLVVAEGRGGRAGA